MVRTRRLTGRVTPVVVAGELLLTAGVVVGLFLLWQLWWTTVEATSEASAAVEEFRESLPPSPRIEGSLRTAAPPLPPSSAPTVRAGQTYGVLIVPAWYGKTNNQMPIAEGTGAEVLNRAAAGHYTGTAQVGEVGNFSLAGHRRTYGNSFLHLPDLKAGEQVIVETAATWYVYEVTDHQVVLPTQIDVIAAAPGDPQAVATEQLMTLTTCHSPTMGAFGNSHRWVTHARFVGWMDRADGMPAQVLSDPGVA